MISLESNQSQRVLLKLTLLLPVFLVVMGINVQQDPANLLHADVAYARAEAMLDATNFEISESNHDERIVQRAYIHGLQQANDVIMLGSSRVLNVRSYLFQDQRFHNHGVSGATLEDFAAIVALYVAVDKLPQTIVIGVDPWLLNENHGQIRWQSLLQEYQDFLHLSGTESKAMDVPVFGSNFSKFRELLSPTYFQTSFSTLLHTIFDSDSFTTIAHATTDAESDYTIWLSDGSISYPSALRNRTIEEIESEAQGYLQSEPIYSLGDYRRIDTSSVELLNHLIRFIQGEQIEVVMFLPPYQPTVYGYFANSDEYSIVLEVEEHYRQMAADSGIRVIGSYDPDMVNCEAFEFFDGMHPKPACLDAIFADLGSDS